MDKLIERLREEAEDQLANLEGGTPVDACPGLLKIAADTLQSQALRIKKLEEALEEATAVRDWLASCTAATAMWLADRKASPKHELARHDSILEKLESWLKDDFSRFPLPSANISGVLHRVTRARTTLSSKEE